MRAILRRGYGGPEALRLEQVPPPAPGPKQVLVRVAAASVNAMDAHMLLGRPAVSRLFTGLARPKDPRIGVDVSGVVEAVGTAVTRFAAGDAVFGAARGAFAEIACADEHRLAAKPAAVSFEQAAALPVAGLTALQGLRDAARVKAGQKLLVVGAGGGVGGFAVQIAAALGARVTAETSSRHVERVGALGAERVLDRASDNFLGEAERYDVIFDLGGTRSFGLFRRVLTPDGRVAAAGIGGLGEPKLGAMAAWGGRVAAGMLRSRLGRRKLVFVMARAGAEDLAALAAMVEAGTLTPPVTRTFPLAEAAEALRTLLAGEAGGKIVLNV